MTQSFPFPSIQVFERLQVTDGLRITAERWRRAHDYHRQRQNLHYQALHQPGIVSGLGVHPSLPPPEVPSKYRDGCWLQIQPGIALDWAGNPIVVPEMIDFHITTKPSLKPVMVYVVLSYVDPQDLKGLEAQEWVRETFRIDEKNTPPTTTEVELCRIHLAPNVSQIKVPEDVFAPGLNQIDLRDRPLAQLRPQRVVHIGEVIRSDDPTATRRSPQLAQFAQSVPSLYSAMNVELGRVGLLELDAVDLPYDVLYLTGEAPFFPSQAEAIALKQYIDQGGVLVVDVPASGATLARSMMDFAQFVGTPLKYLEPPPQLRSVESPNHQHPLRLEPFVFAQFPQIASKPVQLLVGGGIVMVLGDLASAWGITEGFLLPRETLRSAQEFGINLLTFAHKRRNWMQLLQNPTSYEAQPRQANPQSGTTSTLGMATSFASGQASKPRSEQIEQIIGQI